MMINLKDNSEKDKYILELFRTSPNEAFRLLFDAYHMKLCIYAVQLTDSWLSRFLAGIIFYTREVLLTSHYEKRLFEYASQPRVAGSDIRLLSYLWS